MASRQLIETRWGGWWDVGSAIALGAALVYVVARAVLVPLTYDEATTFYRYVEGAPGALLDFTTAANHLLNSALTRGARALFGSAPLVLRLSNVAAGAAYLLVVAAVARRARHPGIGFGIALLLGTNPYLLEFFALSRGYGLAVALVTGGCWCLVRWYENPRHDPAANRRLGLALGLSAAAVAASFAALVVFVAVAGVVAARIGWRARRGPSHSADSDLPLFRPLELVAWGLVTILFSVGVYARDRTIVPGQPVTARVEVAGLYEEERAELRVFRADVTGRLREVPRDGRGRWDLSGVREAWDQLRVVLPAADDDNLSVLDVTVDRWRHRRDRHAPGPWTHYDLGVHRVLRNQPDLAWRPDAAHRRAAWLRGVGVSLVLGVVMVALGAGGRVLVRRGVMGSGEARRVIGAVAGVATIAAAPLHVLRRGGELFFGGQSGLVPDTLGSLLQGSAHASAVPTEAAWIVAVAFVGVAAAVALAAAGGGPAIRTAAAGPAVLVAVIAIAVIEIEVQHRLLGTPYLMARTALFFLPLLLLVPLLAADALATLGRPAAVVMTVLVLAAGGASAAQLWRVGNTSAALDWTQDAATPAMLDAAAQSWPDEPPAAMRRIGVEWMFYPVARYYAERRPGGSTRYDVVVLPGDGLPFDATYARPGSGLGSGVLLQRYPDSDAALWRAAP